MPEGSRVRSHDHTSRATVDGRRFESRVREFDLPFENGWTIAVRWNGHGIAGAWNFVDEPEAGVVTVTGRDGRVVVWDGGKAIGRSMDHSGQRLGVPAGEILDLIDEVATWSSDQWPIIDRV